MADNIKIVGEILNQQQVSRYDSDDTRLFSSSVIKKDFGQQNDYIEYFVYDAGGNVLNINYSYKDFKLPNTSYIDPVNGSLPIIEIDPVKDLQNLGYSSGEFSVYYNFFSNKISDSSAGLFLKEISADRTELKVASTVLTNQQIEEATTALINQYTGSAYFVEYLINFGNNSQVVVVNTALNKIDSGYEILFKLYQPLPDNIQEKVTLWVVEEKVNPYIFDINLDRLIISNPGPKLRGPNFNISIPNQNNVATSYQTYGNLVNNINSISTASYQQFLSLVTSQSIDINVDYTDFNNFVFFSSAKKRITNFYNKVKDIEDYKIDIAKYTVSSSTYPSMLTDLNRATASINNIIAGFDGFEHFLYFNSGSTLSSSLDYSITPYPKSGSILPYPLLSTGSNLTQQWFAWATGSAEEYDNENQNKLTFTVPSFIKDDENNEPYLNFLDMVGHYFDNVWIFLSAVTDINLANNNLDKGVSKDLVYYVLESLGTKLYNKYGDSDNISFLIGQSGSAIFDNNFTSAGSYLNAIPRKDLLAEYYKRIYHNLPLLLKTKGTAYGLQTLISTFGISNRNYYTIGSQSFYTPTGSALISSILPIKEYGGYLKSNTLNEYNTDKIRIISSSILTGSVLSPYVSLQTYPTASSQFRTNDLHYVDISFSPQEKIDEFISESIRSTSPSWNIDNYIGDPRQQYSSSYVELTSEKQTYLSPLSGSIIPFTGSAGSGSIAAIDYNSFIRLIQTFDNSLFKTLQDFIPARVNLSTGVTITSPILERNKWSYAKTNDTSNINTDSGSIEVATIGTEYTDLYDNLSGSRLPYYDGNISGSNISVHNYFTSNNVNPYLIIGSTTYDSWAVSGSVQYSSSQDFVSYSLDSSSYWVIYDNPSFNSNLFNHSDFNILLNNVSQSVTSSVRDTIEYIYGTTGSILCHAQLQDSYLSLRTHQLSRYDGVKLSSLEYNNYNSASDDYDGDISYGKTAAIDYNVRKIGLFTEIKSNTFLPKRNNVALKYLVDEFGGLTELNQRNKHWIEIQNTFIAGNTLDVSLFDNQKFSNQKLVDGTKPIFDSGYAYYPILYFASCSVDPKIYFENLGQTNANSVKATNSTPAGTISGSSSLTNPISASYVMNMFNTVAGGVPSYYNTGSLNTFPSYSAPQGDDYRASANISMNFGFDNSVTSGTAVWALQLYKNGSLISESEQTFNVGGGGTTTNTVSFKYTSITTGDEVEFSNSTNALTRILTSNGGEVNGFRNINVPGDGSQVLVYFYINKIVPASPNNIAADSTPINLYVDNTSVDSATVNGGGVLSATLSGFVTKDSAIRIEVFEG